MTAFDKPFMFLDNPAGGNDQLDKMKAAGFLGAFGNVIDYPPEAWDVHRARAKAQGMFFGPWGRTGHPPPVGIGFERAKAQKIRDTALVWGGTPYVLNNEKEIDGSGSSITSWEAQLVGDDDAGISMEAWPFGNVDWKPIAHKPVLPQIMPVDWGWKDKTQAEIMARAQSSKDAWHLRGVKCVYFTFGAYGGMSPSQFDLKAPYSLYTADSIGVTNYQAWKPTSTGFKGCIDVTPPPPTIPSTAATRKEMTDAARAWEAGQGGPKPLTRITIARRIVEDFYTNEQWLRMAPTIKEILDQEQDEG